MRSRLAGSIPAKWSSMMSVDDVIQQTYVDAICDFERFAPRTEQSLLAWLIQIAPPESD